MRLLSSLKGCNRETWTRVLVFCLGWRVLGGMIDCHRLDSEECINRRVYPVGEQLVIDTHNASTFPHPLTHAICTRLALSTPP